MLSVAKHLLAQRETLRGVYPELKRRAQGDKTLPVLVVKFHHHARGRALPVPQTGLPA